MSFLRLRPGAVADAEASSAEAVRKAECCRSVDHMRLHLKMLEIPHQHTLDMMLAGTCVGHVECGLWLMS